MLTSRLLSGEPGRIRRKPPEINPASAGNRTSSRSSTSRSVASDTVAGSSDIARLVSRRDRRVSCLKNDRAHPLERAGLLSEQEVAATTASATKQSRGRRADQSSTTKISQRRG